MTLEARELEHRLPARDDIVDETANHTLDPAATDHPITTHDIVYLADQIDGARVRLSRALLVELFLLEPLEGTDGAKSNAGKPRLGSHPFDAPMLFDRECVRSEDRDRGSELSQQIAPLDLDAAHTERRDLPDELVE